jgi:hypothetical protein
MQTLQKTFENELRKIPEKLLKQLLVKKIEAKGIILSQWDYQQLSDLLNGKSVTFCLKSWRWWKNENIILEINEKDTQKFQQQLSETVEQIPNIFTTLTNELTKNIFTKLNKKWYNEQHLQRKERSGFERRLYCRWKRPLELLKMLLTISQEFGDILSEELKDSSLSTTNKYKIDVLIRLHARACQVTSEIIVLLCSGYADGAMARWRTLHEIAVISLFLYEGGEDLAERYVLHEVIESRKAMREYTRCNKFLNDEPFSDKEIEEIEESYNDLILRFGDSYATSYGWAVEKLKINKPTFSDIEKAVGIDHLRSYYRMASHNVHANPKGVFLKLGLLDEVDILLTGSSNAGLVEPGHSTAISLNQVSTSLGLIEPNLDKLVLLKVMLLLEKEIGEAFIEAHLKLLQDSSQS